MAEKDPDRLVAKNRKAWHDYFILQRFEAGIALLGTEIKAVRAGLIGMRDAHAAFDKGELFVYNLLIGAYKNRGYTEHDERRQRKLLLTKQELKKIERQIQEKGNTVVPLQLYFKGPYLKVEIAVVKGKKQYDKREQKEKAQMQREVQREVRTRIKVGR